MKTSRTLRAPGRLGEPSSRPFLPSPPAFFLALSLLVVALWVGQPTPLVAQQSAMLSMAQKAFNAGDLATARALFLQILEKDPRNVTAQNCLRLLDAQEKKVPAGALTERRLAAILIPKVEFKEATLKEALESLSRSAEKAAAGAGAPAKPNFVLLPGIDPAQKITLSLSQMPLSEVIRYVAQLAGAQVRVEPFAITFSVPKPEAATPAPAP